MRSLALLLALISNVSHADHLFARVSYGCPATDAAVIQDYFEAIVSVGITGLQAINPKLGTRASNSLKEKKLTISCAAYPGFENPIFYKKTIYLGSAIDALNAYQQWANMRRTGLDLVLAIFRHPDPAVTLNSVAVFHEFLHFTGIDNLSTEDHNRVFEEDGPEAWEDVVYSCTESVYPTYGMNGWFKSEEEHQQALAMCQRANP